MGYELQITAAYTTLLLVLAAAWVGGYLDGAQHTAQDLILGKMGENRASYGIKSKPFPPFIPWAFSHVSVYVFVY